MCSTGRGKVQGHLSGVCGSLTQDGIGHCEIDLQCTQGDCASY
jgi:hypothetical protein